METTNNTPNDLTVVDFKPGVGYVCVDRTGKKWIKRNVEGMAVHMRENAKTKLTDNEGHKVHMSKKQRRKLKEQYRAYMEMQKAKEEQKNEQ